MLTADTFIKRGYIPIACNRYAGIAWQGAVLQDFWMWNRQFTRNSDGGKEIQTIRVTNLKDAAIRCWRDGWVPLKPVKEDFLRLLEDTLRNHPGLKMQGVKFPGTAFLSAPPVIPVEYLSREALGYLGMKATDTGCPKNE